MIQVLICDDQTVVREGLAAILSTDPAIEVVGLAGDGQEAITLVAETRPDIVLMDLMMPVLNGVQATRELRRSYADLRVLVLTTYASDEKTYLDPAVAGKVMHRAAAAAAQSRPAMPPKDPLTERELDILRLISQGYSNPEIAQRLHLARGTVRNYVSTILGKLGVSDRTQAAVEALRRGLVDPESA